MDTNLIFTAILFLVFWSVFPPARTEPVQDKRALLDFIDNIPHSRKTNWNQNTSACTTWTGITCDRTESRIITVRLPFFGLSGIIPPNTLTRLSGLRILSLRSNRLNGLFPSDLLNLRNLTALYLENNNFQGPLPADFSGWKNVSVLNFSGNNFNGSIPASLSNLTLLTVLKMANNSFSGEFPDIDIPSLKVLDLSNNNLTGALPGFLSRFPTSYFSGNNFSSRNENPSLPPSPSPLSSTPKTRSRISESAILAIVIGTCVLAFFSIAFLLIVTNRKKEEHQSTKEKATKTKDTENQRLVFFQGYDLAFDLEDLLRASAELLGKGSFGTAYRAALEDGTTVAVKRLKGVVVGRKEFEQQMEVVGGLKHDNVSPLRAYYYSKDEKLMVYDYYNLGSVFSSLHGKRGEKRESLDWEARVNIAVCAAKGLAHIHRLKLVHGNIKSSNIFLNSKNHASIGDLGLATIGNQTVRFSFYTAPEDVSDVRKISESSDVYSFGVVVLELLTGKSAVKRGKEEGVNLVKWVESVVREEWTGEVFDVEVLGDGDIEEEMVGVLRVGLECVGRKRPKMEDVVRMLEEVRGDKSRSTDSTPPSAGVDGSSSAS